MNGTSMPGSGIELRIDSEYVKGLSEADWEALQQRLAAAASAVLHAFENEQAQNRWVPLSEAEIAALEASCPDWCLMHGQHDWDLEGAQDGDWTHQQSAFDAVTVCLRVNRDGAVQQLDILTADLLEESFSVDDVGQAVELLAQVAGDWCEAVEFLEDLRDRLVRIPSLPAEGILAVRAAATEAAVQAAAEVRS